MAILIAYAQKLACMFAYLAGLEVKWVLQVFIYICDSCMRAAKALLSLRICASWSACSLFDNDRLYNAGALSCNMCIT